MWWGAGENFEGTQCRTLLRIAHKVSVYEHMHVYAMYLLSCHFFILHSVLELSDWNEEAGEDCLTAPIPFSAALTRALQSAASSLRQSNPLLIAKANISPRFWCLPCTPWTLFERLPDAKSVLKLVSLRGTVIRVSGVRMQEAQRLFECQKCGQTVTVLADDWNGGGGIGRPVICSAEVDGLGCRGTKFSGKSAILQLFLHSCKCRCHKGPGSCRLSGSKSAGMYWSFGSGQCPSIFAVHPEARIS
jgi:DNA replicative helicase MCM subunit Mcm2 (Cdc46/Mcm family)